MAPNGALYAPAYIYEYEIKSIAIFWLFNDYYLTLMIMVASKYGYIDGIEYKYIL